MFTRKALVSRAIHFKGASRIPLQVLGSAIKNSDVLTYDLSLSDPNDSKKSEWGFARQKDEAGFWTVPEEPVLAQWKEVDAYEGPSADLPRRLSGIAKSATICGDRYRLATFGVSGYAVYRGLRGAELSNVDSLIEPERFLELMELIFELETNYFDVLARKGFHGIEFQDDWGDRQTSKMTLSLWRKLLSHRYAAQFRRAHDSGLDVWFSTSAHCGEFFDDLRQIGVDVVRIDSPFRMEVAAIGKQLRGRLCFSVRLDELVEEGGVDIEKLRLVADCLLSDGNGMIGLVPENIPARMVDKIAAALGKLS